jgi:hypothetical protein
MYKIKDFTDELHRRNKLFLSNHLFIGVFIFFVVFIGTISIWFEPLFGSEEVSYKTFFCSLLMNMTSFNLFAYSIPLLAVLSLDGCFKIVQGKSDSDNSTLIWMVLGLAVSLAIISILFAISRNDIGFSPLAFIAWLLTLYIWLVNNIEDVKYQVPSDNSAPSGGDVFNATQLRRGNND